MAFPSALKIDDEAVFTLIIILDLTETPCAVDTPCPGLHGLEFGPGAFEPRGLLD
jgi:hypothetical protein